MKKVLLSLVAVLASLSTYAQYKVDDYIYTGTAKFKVTQLLDVPSFSEKGKWGISNDNFEEYVAEDADDFSGIKSVSSDAEGTKITATVPLTYGDTYVVSFKIRGSDNGTSSAAYATDNQNVLAATLTATKGAGIASQTVSSTASILADTWVDVTWAFVDTITVETEVPDGENDATALELTFSRINVGSVLTDVQIVKVTEVFDTRISDAKFSYVEKLLAEPAFNTAAAKEAAETLAGNVELLKEGFATGKYDDLATAEEMMAAIDEDLEVYLDASSYNLTDEKYFKYITNITAAAKINRKGITSNSVQGGFRFRKDGTADGGETNWQHGQGSEWWTNQIQGTYENGGASIELVNDDLPAGKYFVVAEMRNAYCDKNYNLTYTLESGVQAYVGSETKDCGTISGDRFQKLYTVGEVKEGEPFVAGFHWDGINTGSAWHVYKFELRSFEDIASVLERKKVWAAFKEQWNAAVNARNKNLALQENKDYPYANDSLKRSLAQWDPLYNDVVEKGWVDENGDDTGVATNPELEEWTTYQGYYPIAPADGEEASDDYTNYSKYALVRGYEKANAYVETANKAITDFYAAIQAAENVLADDMYSEADPELLEPAIDDSKKLLAGILEKATDETRESDENALALQLAELEEAKQLYIKDGTLVPFIDIDFSNAIEPVYDEEETLVNYVINGKSATYDGAGQVAFALTTAVHLDNTVAVEGSPYQIGLGGTDACDGVLRIGKGDAVVSFDEANIPTDNDAIRIQFDMWGGKLINRSAGVEIRNSADERIAGFSIGVYDGKEESNDFQNPEGTGMVVVTPTRYMGNISNVNDASILTEANRSSFDLIIDYKAQTMKGSVTYNGKTSDGALVALPKLEENKAAKFAIVSNYDNAGRRCWFDNLKIFKYKSSAEGKNEAVAVKSIDAAPAAAATIYTISGAKVNGLQKGINIVRYADGSVRKVFVK